VITTPWPNLLPYATPAGEIDPYDPSNTPLFRGEEAFAPEITGWRRWSKPSPEPHLDETFEGLLLDSIAREKAAVAAMVETLADKVAASVPSAPLLVAILRAGVPVGAPLARSLRRRFGEPVPLAALSLFDGLGWDTAALEAALRDHSGRPVVFVDGWTSGGGVARELRRSHERWLSSGRPDFTDGEGPRLAVLLDPRGLAGYSALQADRFVPSSLFTAPETLGFSRGFAAANGGMFRVYRFPDRLLRPSYVEAWMAESGDVENLEAPTVGDTPAPEAVPPPGWRLHVNEVVRALINRNPREVLLRDDEGNAAAALAPVLHLCRLRDVPVSYGHAEVAAWGAVAAARMKD
jgi:hypothetical protein